MARILLASFDRVPAPKGASAHILANVRALAARHAVSLVTLGETPLPGLRHLPLALAEPNWLRRALAFHERLRRVLDEEPADAYHVRSPWEGLACPTGEPLVYEVNGFMSVEAPYHFARVAAVPGLVDRLRRLEDALLDRAALVVTPSAVTAEHIEDRGVDRARIRVVPNTPAIDLEQEPTAGGSPEPTAGGPAPAPTPGRPGPTPGRPEPTPGRPEPTPGRSGRTAGGGPELTASGPGAPAGRGPEPTADGGPEPTGRGRGPEPTGGALRLCDPEPTAGAVRLCYLGTLAPWQGLEDVLRVLPRLGVPFQLTVITGAPGRARRRLIRKAARLGLADRLAVQPAVAPEDLGRVLRAHDIGLVPLVPCARNLVQGCMPIKLLDLLAAGVAVLAPDLPVVRQVVGEDYPLYRRGSPDALLALLERLARDADVRRALAAAGLARVRARFSPAAHAAALLGVYDELLGPTAVSPVRPAAHG